MLSLGVGTNLAAGAELVPISKAAEGVGGSTATIKTMLVCNAYSIVLDGKYISDIKGGRGGHWFSRLSFICEPFIQVPIQDSATA